MKSTEKGKGVRRYFRGELLVKDEGGEEPVIGVVYPAGTHHSNKTEEEFIDDICEFVTREAVKLLPALRELCDSHISLVERSQDAWEVLQQLQLVTSSPDDIIARSINDKLEVIQNGQTEERNTLH